MSTNAQQAQPSVTNVQEILPTDTGIVAYSPFYAQLEELKKTNAVTVFDYTTPAGIKEAKSYIFKLRKTEIAVDNMRKELGEESRQHVLKVNSEAKSIIAEVQDMRLVHQSQIDAIEKAEEERVAGIQERIKGLTQNAENVPAGATSESLKHLLATVEATDVDTSFAEFMHIAVNVKKESFEYLCAMIALAEKREADARELERLRVEAAERSRLEREEKIRKDAQEAAEVKAERDRVEAENKAAKVLQEAADAAAKREAEAKIATEKAIADARLAGEKMAEQLRRDLEAKSKAAADADALRAADVEHKRKVHNEALDKLTELLASGADAKVIIQAVIKGEIPHIKIVY